MVMVGVVVGNEELQGSCKVGNVHPFELRTMVAFTSLLET